MVIAMLSRLDQEKGNLEFANCLLSFMSDKLQISRMQRDLSDSTVMRNIGVALGHAVVAYKSIIEGLGKLSVNLDRVKEDLAYTGLLAEAYQIILKKENVKDGDEIVDVVSGDKNKVRLLRGRVVSMIFQDPMSSLHPFYKIGDQLAEGYLVHNSGKKKEAKARAIELLDRVGISDPHKRADEFPHQFSGGMRQRVMIAMALMNTPKVLIADEPTTALDVTVQAQILTLLKDLQKEFHMGILLITHDLGIVAQVADRVNVMYAGDIVESGSAEDIFYNPMAPYTVGLLNSIPKITFGQKGRLRSIEGQPPSLINLPSGCAFSPRCVYKNSAPAGACDASLPDLLGQKSSHLSRCHIPESARGQLFQVGVK